MTRVVIQPAANKDSRIHYRNTVDTPVDISKYQSALGADFGPLSKLTKDGKIALWGVTPGKNQINVNKYKKLQEGDIAIFTKDNFAFASAKIVYLFHNKEVATDIWSTDPDGQTWEYMYALDEVTPRNIPYLNLCNAIDSKPNDKFMGFRPLDASKSAGALELLGIENTSASWDLSVGTEIKRTELHQIYGGAGWGGIEPSARSLNILLFTNPTKGKKFGYNFDRELEDGTFQYTGDGQEDDQDPNVGGNKAILEHRRTKRSLRLFEATKKETIVRYVGEYELGTPEYEIGRAPDRNEKERDVLIFNLVPVGVTKSVEKPADETVVSQPTRRATEQNVNESHTRTIAASTTVASRNEAKLQTRYELFLKSTGIDVATYTIPVKGTRIELKADLVDFTNRRVIEVKAGVARTYVRNAIGQVLDYVYQLKVFGEDNWKPALLLPGKPTDDLLGLTKSLGIEVVWEETPGTFISSSD